MKFYQKSNGKWQLGNFAIPSGTCVEITNDVTGRITIQDMDGTVYVEDLLPTDFTDGAGKKYASQAAYEAATAVFFCKRITSDGFIQDANHRFVTDTQITSWNEKEDSANKKTSLSNPDDTSFPTTKAVKSAIDNAVLGLLNDRGNHDASSNTFPTTGGSGVAGAILKGDIWFISVVGTLGGVAVNVGDQVRALQNAPGQTASNWAVSESNLGYAPENVANKATTMIGSENSNIIYLTAKAIYDWATGLFAKKLVKKSGVTLTKANWVLSSGYYTYTLTYTEITTESQVSITAKKESTSTVQGAQIEPNGDVNNGNCVMYAKNAPQADIIVDIVISY